MEQRIDLVTLRVDDVDDAVRRYRSLGWQPTLVVGGEVAFFQTAPGVLLSLFAAEGFDTDVAGRPVGYTLGQVVDSPEQVRAAAEALVASGAVELKAPQQADWGGYHAVVQDRAGVCWELAHNPGWSVADDGTVTIGPVES